MLKSFENFSEFAGGSGKEGESGEKKPGLEPMKVLDLLMRINK